jgi:predicted RNA-binding protein with PUA-like domain
MACWLFKTEPSAYSFDRLERERKATWDGVANPVALKNLAEVRRGDEVLVYHTGKEKAVVGRAWATSDARPDPGDPKLWVVDVEAVARLERPVTLAEIKATPSLHGWDLVRLPRLSVVRVGETERAEIERLSASRG